MQTTAEKPDDSDNKLEDDMKQLQNTVADLHKSSETKKQQGKPTYRKSIPKQRNMPQQQKLQCYNCGSEERLQFKCPSNKRNKRKTRVTEESEKHQTKYVANKSSGLYIDCKINSIPTPLRRLPVHMSQEADKQTDEMLKKDVVQLSTSPWASGIVLVKEKDGSKRFCVDYSKLNDITIKDACPLPRIDDSLGSRVVFLPGFKFWLFAS